MKKVILLLLWGLIPTYVFATTYTEYITVGEWHQLNIRITSYNVYPNPTITVSDKDVVEVTSNPQITSSSLSGLITYNMSWTIRMTGKKVGVSTVRVKYGYGAFGTGNITNVDDTYMINVVDLTSITIPNNLTLTVGEQYTFSPTIAHPKAYAKLTWQSSDPTVATINSDGVLTATGVGTTTIICTAQNGVSAQCFVTVNPVLASNVSLDTTTTELMAGEILLLTASVSPVNTTNPSVEWSSSDSNVATVDANGLVTAVCPGQCSITATTTDGSNRSASCHVNVLSDVLYVDDAVAIPSGTLILPIQLDNVSAITSLQFELQLPEGVSVMKDETDKLKATLSDRAVDQSIIGAILSNGNYQFVIFSGTSTAIVGSNGAIAYLSLEVGTEMPVGEYSIIIKEVELTKTNGESLHHKDMKSTLTLTEAIIGDTNGDGKVTVTDAVGIVNHILHRTPSVFITKAADVNGDENITISDAVSVVNIVLNK